MSLSWIVFAYLVIGISSSSIDREHFLLKSDINGMLYLDNHRLDKLIPYNKNLLRIYAMSYPFIALVSSTDKNKHKKDKESDKEDQSNQHTKKWTLLQVWFIEVDTDSIKSYSKVYEETFSDDGEVMETLDSKELYNIQWSRGGKEASLQSAALLLQFSDMTVSVLQVDPGHCQYLMLDLNGRTRLAVNKQVKLIASSFLANINYENALEIRTLLKSKDLKEKNGKNIQRRIDFGFKVKDYAVIQTTSDKTDRDYKLLDSLCIAILTMDFKALIIFQGSALVAWIPNFYEPLINRLQISTESRDDGKHVLLETTPGYWAVIGQDSSSFLIKTHKTPLLSCDIFYLPLERDLKMSCLRQAYDEEGYLKHRSNQAMATWIEKRVLPWINLPEFAISLVMEFLINVDLKGVLPTTLHTKRRHLIDRKQCFYNNSKAMIDISGTSLQVIKVTRMNLQIHKRKRRRNSGIESFFEDKGSKLMWFPVSFIDCIHVYKVTSSNGDNIQQISLFKHIPQEMDSTDDNMLAVEMARLEVVKSIPKEGPLSLAEMFYRLHMKCECFKCATTIR